MTKGDKNIVGQILAKTYRIERFLGAGTIGTVYVARHVRSGGLYAVKVLHKKLAASPEVYQRFQDEARLIATLRHPHIHPITDFDRDDSGLPFFVMELLEGETLQQRLKNRETLPIPQLVEVVQQVGSALHTAHRSGIVHRNLKPENIFLVRHDLGDRVTESAKVMDFGLSRFRLRAAAAGAGPSAGPRDTAVHVTDFMAPELLREGEAAPDGRADQWALAVIAFKSLSGKLPFEDDTPEETQRRILNEPPRPLNKLLPDLPAHVVAAINRGMAKRREDRYETTLDFVRAVCSKAPTLAGGDVGDGVPQARAIAPSGRIAAPMPPMPSAPLRAASTPPAMPRLTPPAIPATPPQRPTPVAAPPPVVASPPVVAAPAAPSPPVESGPAAAPRLLTPPPLLLTEAAPAPAPTPSRGPSTAVIVGGGALALLVGIGATILWVQHKPAPTVEGPAPVVSAPPAQPVVEALDAFPPAPTAAPLPTDATPDAGRDTTGIPPLRGAGTGEVTPTPVAPAATVPAKPPEPAGATPGPATAPPTPGTPPPAAATGRPPGTGPDGTIKLNPPGSSSGNLLFKPSPGGAPTASSPTGSEPAAPAPKPSEPSEPAGSAAGATEGPDKSGDKTPEDLMRDAQTAYVRGERQRAIELALQVAERGGPTAAGAWRFLGSAACSIRNAAIASRAYNSLSSPDHKQMVVELCQRNGLALQNGQFVSSE
ncbi:MAG: protein kinase [Polyangia bacterium]